MANSADVLKTVALEAAAAADTIGRGYTTHGAEMPSAADSARIITMAATAAAGSSGLERRNQLMRAAAQAVLALSTHDHDTLRGVQRRP